MDFREVFGLGEVFSFGRFYALSFPSSSLGYWLYYGFRLIVMILIVV